MRGIGAVAIAASTTLVPVAALVGVSARSAGASTPPAGNIGTVAGNGSTGTSGNGGAATSANLHSPSGAVVDGQGNIYVADTANNRVQFVAATSCATSCAWGLSATTAGDVYTIVGSSSGTSGHSGNGGAASSALLSGPRGLALDSAGDLFVADTGNNRIQEIALTTHPQWGTTVTADDIYTVAGSSTGSSGSSGNGGAATSALLNGPSSIAIDASNNLYIADTGNNRVQFVASTTCSANCPWGLSSTTANDIYTVVGSSSGTSGATGDGGAATSALLNAPAGVALDGDGNLYVADTSNNRVREVASSSGTKWGVTMTSDHIYTVVGNQDSSAGANGAGGPAVTSGLSSPSSVTVDATGNLFIADTNEDRIVEVASIPETEWGLEMGPNCAYTIAGTAGSSGSSGDGGATTSALLNAPLAIAVDQGGDVFVADTANHKIRQMTEDRSGPSPSFDLTTIAGTGSAGTGTSLQPTENALSSPSDTVSNAKGDLFISDTSSNRVVEIAATTGTNFGRAMTAGDFYTVAGSSSGTSGYSGDGGAATSATLNAPHALALDNYGDLFISDYANNVVREVAATTHTQWGISMTVGNIYTIAGGGSGSGLGGAATSAQLNGPEGLVFDNSTIDTGNLYIADSGNNRVDLVAGSSAIAWQWNGSTFTVGDIYAIVGSSSGTSGYSGNGGSAASALLNAPHGLALDPSGDMFIADAGNNRIQFVGGLSRACAPSCTWGISATEGDIYTLAGNASGLSGGSTNGTAATSAEFTDPTYVRYAVSTTGPAGGDLIITDHSNNRIVAVPATTESRWGLSMTADDAYTIAGSSGGTGGYSADEQLATSSYLMLPGGVDVLPSGDLVITDTGCNRIYRLVSSVDPLTQPTPTDATAVYFAGPGGGLSGPEAVTTDALGDLYTVDTGESCVSETAVADHTQWGEAMTGGLTYMLVGSCATAGSSANGATVGTIATSRLNSPSAIAFDGLGNLFVADTLNHRVVEVAAKAETQFGISMSANLVYAVAGTGTAGSSGNGGAATSANLNAPGGVALNPAGDLFIADSGNNRVQTVAHATETLFGQSMTANDVYTVAGSATGTAGHSGNGGAATSALLNNPNGLVVQGRSLYIADSGNNRVQAVAGSSGSAWGITTSANDIYTVAGSSSGTSGRSGDGTAASSALLSTPTGVAFDSSGDLYLSDSANNRILEVPTTSGTQWSRSMTANAIETVAGDVSGSSGSSGDGGPATSALFNDPVGIGFDPMGNLYIADYTNVAVRELAGFGSLTSNVGQILPGETTGGSNPSEQNDGQPSRNASDVAGTHLSVNVENRQANVNVNDSSIPGRGVSLNFARTYSAARASVLGPLGYGWTDSYAMSVATDPVFGSSVEDVTQENGSVLRFVLQPDGTYATASRVEATLSNSSGTWTLTRNGSSFTFNSSGQLTAEGDRNSYSTTLSYSSGHLSSVSDSGSRSLSFTWGTCGSSSCITGVSDPGSRSLVFHYDGSGNLDYAEGIAGGTDKTTYAYDAAHRLVTIGDPVNNAVTTTVAYGPASETRFMTDNTRGPITFIGGTSPYGVGTTIATSTGGTIAADTLAYGDLVSEADAVGTTAAVTTGHTYSLVSNGASSTTDGLGNTSLVFHDPAGNVTGTRDNLGRGTSATYNGTNDQTSSTSSLGEATASSFTSGGDPTGSSWTLPGGSSASTSIAYGTSGSCAHNDAHDQKSVTDANANVTNTCADTYGMPASSTDTSTTPNAQTATSYNNVGQLQNEVSPLGNVSGGTAANYQLTYSYDTFANVSQLDSENAAGTGTNNTKKTYDANGNVLTSTDGNGNVTSYTYNEENQLVKTTLPVDASGASCAGSPSSCVTTSLEYGLEENVRRSTDGRGKVTTNTYDPLGRLLTSTDPRSKVTTSTYDVVGNKTSVTDPDGNETQYVYDAVHEVLKTIQPVNSSGASCSGSPSTCTTLLSTYDPAGNKTSFTDAAGNETTYAYDALGELTSVTDPLGRTTTFTYDAQGNKYTETNPDSNTATYTYNSANQVTGITYSDGVTHSVAKTYDLDGQLHTMTDASGTSTWDHGNADRTADYKKGSTTELTYSFDAAGNLTSLNFNALSHTVTQGFDAMNRQTSVTDWNSNETTFSYDANSNLSAVDYGYVSGTPPTQAVAESLAYNNSEQLTGITDTNSGGTVQSFSYTPDDAGLVSSETDTGTPGAGSTSYGYNPFNELTSAGSSSYTFNTANDLTKSPAAATQTFNANNEVTLQGSGTANTCPAAPTGSGTTAYCYDKEGNRTSATPTTGTGNTYTWSESHQMTGASIGGTSTSYTYDGQGLLQSESGGTTATYLWNEVGVSLPNMMSDGTNVYLYGPSDAPVEQINISSGTTNYLLSDHLGSIRGITDTTGSLVGATSYDPWGGVSGTSGTATSPFGYAASYLDPSSGLNYMRARWYDSNTGQFMSLDPMVMDTQSPFAYVNNDPINGVDPSGANSVVCSLTGFTCGNSVASAYENGLKQFVNQLGEVLPFVAVGTCVVESFGICALAVIGSSASELGAAKVNGELTGTVYVQTAILGSVDLLSGGLGSVVEKVGEMGSEGFVDTLTYKGTKYILRVLQSIPDVIVKLSKG